VTFATLLTYLNINQAAYRLGALGSLLNRSGLSIRNSVLLYEQLIHPVMDNVYRTWWSTAHTLIRNLRVLKPYCLNILANTPCFMYISKEI